MIGLWKTDCHWDAPAAGDISLRFYLTNLTALQVYTQSWTTK